MRKLRLLLLVSVTAIGALGVVFVRGMRRKSPAVINVVRRVSRSTKPLVLKSAGTPGSNTSVVRHVGRNTGRSYETPVVAVRTDDGFAIALPYGPNTDWLQNVLAGGGAEILFDGKTYTVDAPQVVPMEAVGHWFAAKEQRMHRQFTVDEALRVHDAGALAERRGEAHVAP